MPYLYGRKTITYFLCHSIINLYSQTHLVFEISNKFYSETQPFDGVYTER